VTCTCSWKTDQTFECASCRRTVCYCCGADDDTPSLCDDCAEERYAQRGVATEVPEPTLAEATES
jgi:hypothetical protein